MATRVQLELRPRSQGVRREITNNPLRQGTAETVTYYADFTDWGASASAAVTSPVVLILDHRDVDKTSTLCSGGGSVVNNVEIEFVITSVTQYERYRIFVKGTIDGDIVECWAYLDGTR